MLLLSRTPLLVREISKKFRRFRPSFLGALLAVLCLGALLLFRSEAVGERVQSFLRDSSATLVYFLEKPLSSFYEIKKNIERYLYIYKNNQALDHLLTAVRSYRNRAYTLERENKELRDMLALKSPEEPFLIVPCFGHYSRLNSDALFIKAGKERGIQRYDIIAYEDTIIGCVEEVSKRTARVLLITDPASRLPVECETSEQEGLLTGDEKSKGTLKLIFVQHPEKIVAGEKIFSSGIDGYFPRGKLVGIVREVADDKVTVEPVFDRMALRYVQVIKPS